MPFKRHYSVISLPIIGDFFLQTFTIVTSLTVGRGSACHKRAETNCGGVFLAVAVLLQLPLGNYPECPPALLKNSTCVPLFIIGFPRSLYHSLKRNCRLTWLSFPSRETCQTNTVSWYTNKYRELMVIMR